MVVTLVYVPFACLSYAPVRGMWGLWLYSAVGGNSYTPVRGMCPGNREVLVKNIFAYFKKSLLFIYLYNRVFI